MNINIPSIQPHEDIAIDVVISVINKAQEKLGVRQNLFQIAHSRNVQNTLVSLHALTPPLAINTEKLLKHTIEKTWNLTDCLGYHLKYLGGSQDEVSQYYYFEAIFSQPTVAYPIAQVTASVFFRVEDKHIDPPEKKATPEMIFRVEGHHRDYDVRYVKLTADWVLAVMMMKMKVFQRIEELRILYETPKAYVMPQVLLYSLHK